MLLVLLSALVLSLVGDGSCAPLTIVDKPVGDVLCPELGMDEPPLLLFLVLSSSPDAFDKRQLIRETWGSKSYSSDVRVVFVMGKAEAPVSYGKRSSNLNKAKGLPCS